MVNLTDAPNRKAVAFLARHDKRHFPVDEVAFYPPISQLTTHPDVLDRIWKELGAGLPAECARFVYRTPSLVHDRSGIILAFGWGTAYAFRLPHPQLDEALVAGAKTVQTWSGGRQTNISLELGEGWLWGLLVRW